MGAGLALLAGGCGVSSGAGPAPADAQIQQDVGYVVVDEFPHDAGAFTQGLDFRGPNLFEGTGIEGASSLRRTDLDSGEVLRRVDLAERHFGEGITVLGGRVFQLTWQSGVCFVYRAATFERAGRFRYDGEGWGLTHNGRRLVMSDGTNVLRFRRPKTFEVVREVEVPQGDRSEPLRLNELEWVDGEIFANVWPTDEVLRIDPQTGEIVGSFDLGSLREREQAEGNPDVTNGIAYLEEEGRLFVTGKYWAHIYEIELTGLPEPPP